MLAHLICSKTGGDTVAAKVDHYVSLSIHDARKLQWGDITPYFECSEKGVIYSLLIQVWCVS